MEFLIFVERCRVPHTSRRTVLLFYHRLFYPSYRHIDVSHKEHTVVRVPPPIEI